MSCLHNMLCIHTFSTQTYEYDKDVKTHIIRLSMAQLPAESWPVAPSLDLLPAMTSDPGPGTTCAVSCCGSLP